MESLSLLYRWGMVVLIKLPTETPLGRGRAEIWTYVCWRVPYFPLLCSLLLEYTKHALSAGPLCLLSPLPGMLFLQILPYLYLLPLCSNVTSAERLSKKDFGHQFHHVGGVFLAILRHQQGVREFRSILTLFTVYPEIGSYSTDSVLSPTRCPSMSDTCHKLRLSPVVLT